jgi:hypothetical protein
MAEGKVFVRPIGALVAATLASLVLIACSRLLSWCRGGAQAVVAADDEEGTPSRRTRAPKKGTSSKQRTASTPRGASPARRTKRDKEEEMEMTTMRIV